MQSISTHLNRLLITLVAGCLAVPALAHWQLDTQQAALHFISIKNNSVGEIHQFTQLSGSIDDNGNASIQIQLDSVDTAIEIRDQRMREHLFMVADHPQALITAKLDAAALYALPVGTARLLTVEFNLQLHTQQKTYSTKLGVVKTSDQALHVETFQPIILNLADFGMTAGVAKLQELAGLQSIATAVPVNFTLVFRPQ